MPHAEVAIVPGSHGGFDRIDELNDRIVAFIKSRAARRGGTSDQYKLRDVIARDDA